VRSCHHFKTKIYFGDNAVTVLILESQPGTTTTSLLNQTTMDILETLCKELQLSHQHISRLLLTERSLVSKSISEDRTLPTAATVQLLECYKAWQQLNPIDPVEAPATLSEAERKRWERELRKTNHRLLTLQLKLETIEKQIKALLLRRQFLHIFAANPTLHELQRGWAEVLQRDTSRKLERLDGFALGRMQMQEALLRKKVEMITETLGK
jgi:hypothetical protein